MTRALTGEEVARHLQEAVPGSVEAWDDLVVRVKPESILEVCRSLKESQTLALDYLVAITGVDYLECFEMVYHLTSIARNHSAVLKARVYDREGPAVPSVVDVWQGADFQEREVWDLMGVAFTGHPNLKRILTWDGFEGHPLQKTHLGG